MVGGVRRWRMWVAFLLVLVAVYYAHARPRKLTAREKEIDRQLTRIDRLIDIMLKTTKCNRRGNAQVRKTTCNRLKKVAESTRRTGQTAEKETTVEISEKAEEAAKVEAERAAKAAAEAAAKVAAEEAAKAAAEEAAKAAAEEAAKAAAEEAAKAAAEEAAKAAAEEAAKAAAEEAAKAAAEEAAKVAAEEAANAAAENAAKAAVEEAEEEAAKVAAEEAANAAAEDAANAAAEDAAKAAVEEAEEEAAKVAAEEAAKAAAEDAAKAAAEEATEEATEVATEKAVENATETSTETATEDPVEELDPEPSATTLEDDEESSEECDYAAKYGSSHTMALPKNAECEIYKSGLSPEEITLVLKLHNEFRSKVAKGNETRGDPGPQPPAANMRQMVWNDELAKIAQAWANQCPDYHDLGSNRRVCDNTYHVGQNIHYYWGYDPEPDWNRAATEWYVEVADMPSSFADSFKLRDDKKIGHYTQVVWADTNEVGCGLIYYEGVINGKMFPESKTYVCNYGPSGNTRTLPIYIKGPAASQCPNGPSEDWPDLCA